MKLGVPLVTVGLSRAVVQAPVEMVAMDVIETLEAHGQLWLGIGHQMLDDRLLRTAGWLQRTLEADTGGTTGIQDPEGERT